MIQQHHIESWWRIQKNHVILQETLPFFYGLRCLKFIDRFAKEEYEQIQRMDGYEDYCAKIYEIDKDSPDRMWIIQERLNPFIDHPGYSSLLRAYQSYWDERKPFYCEHTKDPYEPDHSGLSHMIMNQDKRVWDLTDDPDAKKLIQDCWNFFPKLLLFAERGMNHHYINLEEATLFHNMGYDLQGELKTYDPIDAA